MATNEIQNGCGSSIEAVRTSNQKRRRVKGDAGKIDSTVHNPQGHLNPIPRSANASRNLPGIPESVSVKEIAERLAKLSR
jgi:hypothetical protein